MEKVEELKKDALAIQEEHLKIKGICQRIDSDEMLQRVKNEVRRARDVRDSLKSVFEPMRNAAFTSYKKILATWKEVEKPVVEAENFGNKLLSIYFMELREKQEKKERERLAAIQKQKEEEERKLQEAIKAEQEGDTEKAEQIIEEVAKTENDETQIAPVVEKPKLDGMHSRKDYDIEIEDESKIPREYLMPNESMIRRVVKAGKGKVHIPGVRTIVKDIPVHTKQ